MKCPSSFVHYFSITVQNIYGIDLPIFQAGRYVLIFEYYGGGPGQQSALIDVYGSQDTQQGELIFNDCAFL